MNRLSTVIWIVVIAVAVFMLYMVKYQVQSLKTQVAQTARELEAEREALHVVSAEWSYLNRPERLKTLAAKYLAASDVTVEQVADVEAIPFPNRSVAALSNNDGIQPVSVKVRGGGMR